MLERVGRLAVGDRIVTSITRRPGEVTRVVPAWGTESDEFAVEVRFDGGVVKALHPDVLVEVVR